MPQNASHDKVQMITHRDDGYSEKIFSRLNVFRKENIMIDLTIVVEGQEFGAHRVVMAAASDSFLQECTQSKIVLKNSNVSVRGFLPLLEYAYTSVLNVPQADVTEVFLAAVHLHMQPVSDFLKPFTTLQMGNNSNNVMPFQPPDLLRLLLLQYGNVSNLDPTKAALLLNQLQLMQMSQMGKNFPHNGREENEEEDANSDHNDQNDVGSVGTPKDDSGVGDEKEDWQMLQKLYGSKMDSNGNSNNNSTPRPSIPTSSSTSSSMSMGAIALCQNEPDIPAPGTIVGRTRTGKPLTQPELPDLPKTGQYMSVRRRTLQTNVPKPHVCQICGSRFTRYHNLKQHIKLHSGVKPYECDICGKRFTRNYTLRLHKMKHGSGQQFACGSCSYTGNNPQEFKAHLRMHQHHPAGQNMMNDPVSMVHPQSRYNAFDPSMLGPGVNTLLALAAQQKENQQFFAQNMGQSGPTSPSVSFAESGSPSGIKTEVHEMTGSDEEAEMSDHLEIDESKIDENIPLDNRMEAESSEVQVQ